LGMDVYCSSFVCVFLCLCRGRFFRRADHPSKGGVLPTALDLVTEVKRKVSWRRPRPELGCAAKGGGDRPFDAKFTSSFISEDL
jgi:hypothetical protein